MVTTSGICNQKFPHHIFFPSKNKPRKLTENRETWPNRSSSSFCLDCWTQQSRPAWRINLVLTPVLHWFGQQGAAENHFGSARFLISTCWFSVLRPLTSSFPFVSDATQIYNNYIFRFIFTFLVCDLNLLISIIIYLYVEVFIYKSTSLPRLKYRKGLF